MIITLVRYSDNGNNTVGKLFIDSEFECYTLEDTYREQKIRGATRIPHGTYRLTLRNEGGMLSRYKQRFGWHDGMLWIRDIPNFKYVYFHLGNHEDDTDGCILVGDNVTTYGGERLITNSAKTYADFYMKVIKSVNDFPVGVVVNILDYDRQP